MITIKFMIFNYLCVLLMTISFYLFLKKPEDRYTFFSFWENFSILVFSVMLLKLLNSYSAIEVAYIVDFFAILILITSFFFNSKSDKSSQKKLKHHLSKLKNYNQKELEKFIINLLQKYQFNSIQKFDVKDANDTINDTYLVAQRDGLFYEIRTIANGKELNERTINEVSNKFRDSTTQIENRILFSNSESKKSTENLIVSYGIKFNLIDSNKIYQLVYAIEPANNIPSNFITQYLLKIIDLIQNLLISIKSKLTPNTKYQKENSIENVISNTFLPTSNTDNNSTTTVSDQKDSTPTDKADDHLNSPITPASADVEETLVIEDIESTVIELEEPEIFDFNSTVLVTSSDATAFNDFIDGEFNTTGTTDDELLFGSPSPITHEIIDHEIGTNIIETDKTQDDDLLLNSAMATTDEVHLEQSDNMNTEFVQDNELMLSMSVSSADIDHIESTNSNEDYLLLENQSNDVESLGSDEMLKILLAEQAQLNELHNHQNEQKKKSRNKFK